VEQKLKAIEISSPFMNPTDFIDEVNEIARTNFRAKEGIDDEIFDQAVSEKVKEFVSAGDRRDTEREKVVNTTGDGQGRILKIDDYVIKELADDWAAHLSGEGHFEPASVAVMDKLIGQLATPMRKLFNGYVGMRLSQGGYNDAGVAKLLACVGHRHENEDDPTIEASVHGAGEKKDKKKGKK